MSLEESDQEGASSYDVPDSLWQKPGRDESGIWRPGASLEGISGKVWHLGEKFDSGGQSKLWELVETENGIRYVAKVYKPFSHGSLEDARLTILKKIASSTSNHILRSHDFAFHGEEGGEQQLVEIMPRCDMTLRKFWNIHELDEDSEVGAGIVLNIVGQIAKALRDLHEIGFVHCDVSPKNLLVNGDLSGFQVLLADFGTADYLGKRPPMGEKERNTRLQHGWGRPEPRLAPAFHWWSDNRARDHDDYFQLGLVILELFEVDDFDNMSYDSRAGYFHHQVLRLPPYIQEIAVGLLNGDPFERLDFDRLSRLPPPPVIHPRMYRSILQPARAGGSKYRSDNLRPFAIARKLAKSPLDWEHRRVSIAHSVTEWLSGWESTVGEVPPPRSNPIIDEDLPEVLLQLEGGDLKTAWKAIWLLDRSIPLQISGHEFYTFADLAGFVKVNSLPGSVIDPRIEKEVAFSLRNGILQAWIEQMLLDSGDEHLGCVWLEEIGYPVGDFIHALNRCVESIQSRSRHPDDCEALYWLALRYCYNPDGMPPMIGSSQPHDLAGFSSHLMRHIGEADQLRRSGRISIWLDAVSWRKVVKASDFGLGSEFSNLEENLALTSYLALQLGANERPFGKVEIEGGSHVQTEMIRHGATVVRRIRITNVKPGIGCLAGVAELRDKKGDASIELKRREGQVGADLLQQWGKVESVAGSGNARGANSDRAVPFSGDDTVLELTIAQGSRSFARDSTVDLHIRWNGDGGACHTKTLPLRFGVIINYGKMVSFTLGLLAVGSLLCAVIIHVAMKYQVAAATARGIAEQKVSGAWSEWEHNPLGSFAEGGGTEASFYPLVLTSLVAIVLMIVALWYCCLKRHRNR